MFYFCSYSSLPYDDYFEMKLLGEKNLNFNLSHSNLFGVFNVFCNKWWANYPDTIFFRILHHYLYFIQLYWGIMDKLKYIYLKCTKGDLTYKCFVKLLPQSG